MLRITTLVENSPGEHKSLVNEHGLSFHIDNGGNPLIFDTGQSDALVRNAARLRVDLSDVRRVVLSHGHFDHSGGLRFLAAQTRRFDVVTGEGFFLDKYGVKGVTREFLGNDFDAEWLADNDIAQITVDEPVREVAPGVYALTDFPRIHPDETVNPRFKVRMDGTFVEDTFADEVMLAIDTAQGLVAVLGCSHPGVKNMLDAAAERLGKPIHGVVGGTHLVEATRASLDLTVEYMRRKDIRVIGVSHCTGEAAMNRLSVFEGRYFHNRTGTTLFFE